MQGTLDTQQENKQWAKDLDRHLTKGDGHMADAHMKRQSEPRIIRVIQIKTGRYHRTPTQILTTPDVGRMCSCRNSHLLLVECIVVRPVWKTVGRCLIKLNILLPYDPAATLDIYLKLNTYICTKTFPWILIAALFVIARTWKRPQYPSVGELIKCGPCRQWNIIPN